MSGEQTGRVEAIASGDAQQANLGQGEMRVYQGTHVHIGAERPRTALFTVLPPPADMVGRSREMAALVSQVHGAQEAGRPVLVSAVHGMAGVGKTALARAVIEQVGKEFPDARLEVELFGFTPGERPRNPGDVLTELLSVAGFEGVQIPSSLPGKAHLWRSWLAERSVVLLLDNARDANQVRPLLPGTSAGSLVVVTSRHSLPELEGASPFSLDILSVADACAMLHQLSGRSVGPDAACRRELARLCGYLPLALRPVAVLLADLTDADLLDLMRSAARPLMHIPEGERSVAAAFAVSYEALSGHAQEILQVCARHPGPDFDTYSVAALSGNARPEVAVALADLARRNMLARIAGGRYAFHDLFLGYAQELKTHLDAATGLERLYAHLAATLATAVSALTGTAAPDAAYAGPPFTSSKAARDWLIAATAELRTGALSALETGSPSAARLANTAAWWLIMDDRLDHAHILYSAAVSHLVQGENMLGRADAVKGLGEVARMRAEFEQATQAYEQARGLYKQIKDQRGQAHAVKGLGEVAAIRGEFERAVREYEQAYRLYDQIGHLLGKADVLLALGDVAAMRGKFESAAEAYEEARWLYEQIRHRRGQAHAVKGLGEVARMRGEYERATQAYEQAYCLCDQIGDRRSQAHVLLGLGEVARMRGEYERATQAQEQARKLYEQTEDRVGQANVFLCEAMMASQRGNQTRACSAYAQASEIYSSTGLSYWANYCAQARQRIGCPR